MWAFRFTEKVKTHLRRIFLEGEETGNKASAAAVCSRIRNQRDWSGRKIFAKEEWLSVDQIAPYFSRLSVLHRSGRLALEQVNPDTTRGGRLSRRGRRDHHKAWNTKTAGIVIIQYTPTTLMLHILRRNSQIVPFKVTRPVVQKFRLGHHWDRMNIVASLFVKVQPSVFQID